MSDPQRITLRRGSLYLSREVYDEYFRDLAGVILLRRDAELLILPVKHAAAGGYFLKVCNSAGDRVVSAPDFFREHGADHDFERRLGVGWDSTRAALVAFDVFDMQT